MNPDYIFFMKTQVILKTLKDGFKPGLDSLLLTKYANIKENSKLIDLGAGTGILSIICNKIYNVKEVLAIEKEKQYYQILEHNCRINNCLNIRCKNLDIHDIPKSYYQQFDNVIINPPYYNRHSSGQYANYLRLVANVETSASVIDFITIAFKLLKPLGIMSMVINTDNIYTILQYMTPNKWGDINIIPVYSNKSSNAKRSIINATKLSHGKLIINSPIFTDAPDALS